MFTCFHCCYMFSNPKYLVMHHGIQKLIPAKSKQSVSCLFTFLKLFLKILDTSGSLGFQSMSEMYRICDLSICSCAKSASGLTTSILSLAAEKRKEKLSSFFAKFLPYFTIFQSSAANYATIYRSHTYLPTK